MSENRIGCTKKNRGDLVWGAAAERRPATRQAAAMRKLYILGAGGFGREVAWLVDRINGTGPVWDLQGFLDDDQKKHGSLEGRYPVVGGSELLTHLCGEAWVVCAVGSAGTRKRIVERVQQCGGARFATLIDPSVLLSPSVTVGEGSVICAGTILTADITVGRHVIINLDCTVGHDARIGDYSTIYPGVHVSGCVTVGEEAELGTGSQIIQGRRIGRETVLGAGAVVVSDLPECCTAVGVPARPLKFRDKRESAERTI